MAGPGWPDLADYKVWARIFDGTDDDAIQDALDAVQNAIIARCPALAGVATPCPPDVNYATKLWTNRLLSRRNSPDGIVGVADLGIATIARFDKDVAQLLSPFVGTVLA